jgi:hypothetical protein
MGRVGQIEYISVVEEPTRRVRWEFREHWSNLEFGRRRMMKSMLTD